MTSGTVSDAKESIPGNAAFPHVGLPAVRSYCIDLVRTMPYRNSPSSNPVQISPSFCTSCEHCPGRKLEGEAGAVHSSLVQVGGGAGLCRRGAEHDGAIPEHGGHWHDGALPNDGGRAARDDAGGGNDDGRRAHAAGNDASGAFHGNGKAYGHDATTQHWADGPHDATKCWAPHASAAWQRPCPSANPHAST